MRQLKPGGVMLIPVGPQDFFTGQVLTRVEKSATTGRVSTCPLMGVRYVPLVSAPPGAAGGFGQSGERPRGGSSPS